MLQLLGQTNCQTFLFLTYFSIMGQPFLKTKISFNRYYLRLFITLKSSLLKPCLRKNINFFLCYKKSICHQLLSIWSLLERACIPHFKNKHLLEQVNYLLEACLIKLIVTCVEHFYFEQTSSIVLICTNLQMRITSGCLIASVGV